MATDGATARIPGVKLAEKAAMVGVIGSDYVGLLSARARTGFRAIGFDTDDAKVELLQGRRSYIDTTPAGAFAAHVPAGHCATTAGFDDSDVMLTPLSHQHEPDLPCVTATAEAIAQPLRIIIKQAITEDVLTPMLERGGPICGQAFCLAFSPELETAATKPFGDIPFYPGPSLGRHCILMEPFHFIWKSRKFGLTIRFIGLAGKIKRHVAPRLEQAQDPQEISPSVPQLLILDLACKKNVGGIRKSPVLELLPRRGAEIALHDPLLSANKYDHLVGRTSVGLLPDSAILQRRAGRHRSRCGGLQGYSRQRRPDRGHPQCLYPQEHSGRGGGQGIKEAQCVDRNY